MDNNKDNSKDSNRDNAERRAMSSIKNNLRYCRIDYLGAAEIKFILSKLKLRMHMPESYIQLKCIKYAFENDPDFKDFRAEIMSEWKRINSGPGTVAEDSDNM